MLTNLLSANCEDVIAGESCTIKLDELDPNEDIVYTVSGNSSNLEGMNISINETNVTLSFNKRFAPDSFTLIFMNKQEKVIHEYHSGGTKTEYKNNTINNTEIIKIKEPYFNESECPEPEPEEPETKTITKVVEQYWQEALLSIVLLLAVFYIYKLKKKLGNHTQNEKATVGSNNNRSERRYNKFKK